MNEVRGVAAAKAALAQRLHDQRQIAVLEIAHAAVDELSAAARRALAEIAVAPGASTSKPRAAASTATPTPVAPPPTMTMSHGFAAVAGRASMAERFMAWPNPCARSTASRPAVAQRFGLCRIHDAAQSGVRLHDDAEMVSGLGQSPTARPAK